MGGTCAVHWSFGKCFPSPNVVFVVETGFLSQSVTGGHESREREIVAERLAPLSLAASFDINIGERWG